MVLRPVGPHPPAVYWRRRGLILAAVLVVVVVVVRASSGPGGGRHAASGRNSATAGSTKPTGPCGLSDLTLRVRGTHAGATASAMRFVGVLHNASRSACSLLDPADVPVWSVTSAKTTVWKCHSPAPPALDLAAGAHKRLASITWQGRVAAPPGCKGRTPARPGAYTVHLRFGAVRPGKLTFSLAANGTSSSSGTSSSAGVSGSTGASNSAGSSQG